MKLRQLEFALEIARSGSFSAAAEICSATQPTLSNAVSQLEEELGAKIFTRTTRAVEVTLFGEYLLPYIEEILRAQSELKKATEAYLNPDHKVLRIGLSPLVDMVLLNEVLSPYRSENPEVIIYFKECLLDDLSDRLDNGSVDIAVVPRDMVVQEWENLRFYEDQLFYIPSDGLKPGNVGDIGINDLPDTPIIMTGGGCGLNRSLEILFAQNAVSFTTYPGAALSYPIIEQWASIGIGAGILPSAKISGSKKQAQRLLKQNDEGAHFEYHWVWKPNLATSPHVTAFQKHIRDRVPALVAGRVK